MRTARSTSAVEWGTAVIGGSSADAFLGTQGDVWDTQWDMFTALIGAIVAQLLLARVHDRQLRELEAQTPRAGSNLSYTAAD